MLNRIPHLLAGGFVATALISAAPLGGAWAEEQQLRQELPQYFGTLVRPQADGALMRHDRARRSAGAGAGLLGSNRSIGTTDDDPSFDDDSPIFEGRGLEVIQRGVRLERDATTDVWAHEDFAYTGTFNSPCGGSPDAGVWVWDLDDDQAHVVTVIASPVGSRANDVKVAAMNSGDILVHSNESCSGGPGGFEIYNVNDPPSPIHLASVRIDVTPADGVTVRSEAELFAAPDCVDPTGEVFATDEVAGDQWGQTRLIERFSRYFSDFLSPPFDFGAARRRSCA